VRRYVHGPGDDEPVVWYEGAGTADRRWLHTDERGSGGAVTNSTGSAFAINSYDEYGIPASTNIGRFQYTDQAWLPEVGLYYYKARMYSPTLGRFMQTDPIGYGDGMNWYDYVGGDPVNRSDPTGNESDEIIVTARRAVKAIGTALSTPLLPKRIELPESVIRAANWVGISEDCAESTVMADCSASEAATIIGGAAFILAVPEIIGGRLLLTLRPNVVKFGGRGEANVTKIIGPPNSVIRGGGQRIFVTDKSGKVVLDITKDRVKPVINGALGPKRFSLTKSEIALLNRMLK
jgi:RHS repeat-associated protein